MINRRKPQINKTADNTKKNILKKQKNDLNVLTVTFNVKWWSRAFKFLKENNI